LTDKEHHHDVIDDAAEIVSAPFSAVGIAILTAANGLHGFFDYTGRILIFTFHTLLQIVTLRLSIRDILVQASQLGVDSIMIVTLCLSFTGMIFAMVVGQQAADYGFGKEYIGIAVVYTMCKDLGPVLGGLIMAGRAGAGITSQIGSMQVTEQIDALRAMAVNPIRYLVVPRVIAMAVMVPIVVFIGSFAGVALGFVPIHYDPVLYVSSTSYFDAVENGLKNDLVQTLFIKAFIFGIIIAIVSCIEGFRTRGGAEGVGVSVTRSVVISMVMIFLADLIITKISPY
jgi:phospholipid/cholesterol/gamma-HCH transport system permease protein